MNKLSSNELLMSVSVKLFTDIARIIEGKM